MFLAAVGVLIGGLIGGLKSRRKNFNSGCGSASAWKFDDTNHSNVTMGSRTFLVHVPPTYDFNVQHPVVLSFHGYGDNDTFQELITGFSESHLQIDGRVREGNMSIHSILTLFALGYNSRISGGSIWARTG
jgi:polyhydroxybutyrate depolymerase